MYLIWSHGWWITVLGICFSHLGKQVSRKLIRASGKLILLPRPSVRPSLLFHPQSIITLSPFSFWVWSTVFHSSSIHWPIISHSHTSLFWVWCCKTIMGTIPLMSWLGYPSLCTSWHACRRVARLPPFLIDAHNSHRFKLSQSPTTYS